MPLCLLVCFSCIPHPWIQSNTRALLFSNVTSRTLLLCPHKQKQTNKTQNHVAPSENVPPDVLCAAPPFHSHPPPVAMAPFVNNFTPDHCQSLPRLLPASWQLQHSHQVPPASPILCFLPLLHPSLPPHVMSCLVMSSATSAPTSSFPASNSLSTAFHLWCSPALASRSNTSLLCWDL